MKILIISFHFYPDLCAGSFRATALVEQLQAAAKKNVQIEVITTLPNRYATYQVKTPLVEQWENVLIRRISLPCHQSGMLDQSIAFAYFAYRARRYIQGKSFDLVYATSSRLLTAVLGAWFARIAKAKLYLDIRDLFIETIEEVVSSRKLKFIKPSLLWLEKWAFNYAHHINIVSPGFESYFKNNYPQKALSYFTNGIDAEFLELEMHQFKNCSNAIPHSFLYAGNIGEGQGLHRIIPPLATKLKTSSFQIIGDGGRRKELAAASQLHPNVKLLPPCGRSHLIQQYYEADILFLHLNAYRAFERVLPSKIFEYAATGKPILAGVGGYAADFIREEIPNAAVFTPCDADHALEALKTLKLGLSPRTEFITKYQRGNIMKKVAEQLLEYQPI